LDEIERVKQRGTRLSDLAAVCGADITSLSKFINRHRRGLTVPAIERLTAHFEFWIYPSPDSFNFLKATKAFSRLHGEGDGSASLTAIARALIEELRENPLSGSYRALAALMGIPNHNTLWTFMRGSAIQIDVLERIFKPFCLLIYNKNKSEPSPFFWWINLISV
jgi:hypothetical protein